MFYLDTSVLLPLYVREPLSGRIRDWVKTLASGELAISDWTRSEFASALGVMVRMQRLEAQIAAEIASAFRRHSDESLIILLPGREDFLRSQILLQQFDLGLRAGDALHLAIASNHGARALYSLDRRLVRIARRLNLSVSLPPA